LDLFLGPAPGSTASILGTPGQGPTPGPGYYAGLGAPGVARDDTPPQSMFTAAAPVVDPVVAPAAEPVAEAPAPPVPPAFMSPVQPATAVAPDSQFTFEQYLARLNALPQFLSPPPVAPIAPMAQGIGSLPPAGLMG
jgi:hypothetical protein